MRTFHQWLSCAWISRVAFVALLAGVPAWAWAQGDRADGSAVEPGTAITSEDAAAEWMAPADAVFLKTDGAWPARLTREGSRLQGVIKTIDGPVLNRRARRSMRPLVAEPEDRADAMSLRDACGLNEDMVFNFEGPGYLIFRIEAPIAADAAPRGLETFKFVSGRLIQIVEGGRTRAAVAIERTWFTYYPPARGASLRGSALVMPGLWGTPEPIVDGTVAALRRDGWAVVRMLSQPSRFTEQMEFTIDPAETELAATRIADLYAQRSAECAYAVEAAFDHVLSRHPELKNLPRVAVGMSGGAMTLPTVVAREPAKYAAAVMVAAGADLWLIGTRSNYNELMVRALDVNWIGGTPDRVTQSRLDLAYLAASPLDPYHTAGVLRGKPVLMIHGSADLAVPAALGDLLWERLGRPERISMAVGHELLFMNLPSMLPRLCAFLREQTAPKSDSSGAGEASQTEGALRR